MTLGAIDRLACFGVRRAKDSAAVRALSVERHGSTSATATAEILLRLFILLLIPFLLLLLILILILIGHGRHHARVRRIPLALVATKGEGVGWDED